MTIWKVNPRPAQSGDVKYRCYVSGVRFLYVNSVAVLSIHGVCDVIERAGVGHG